MPKQTKPRPRQKGLYRVKNWSDYDKALVQRGSITFWLSDGFERSWLYTGEKQRGSQFDYSDRAIEIMLTVKETFHLTNRETEGFMRSLFVMLKIALPVPDHSTLTKRGKKVKVNLPKKASQKLNIVMDSTGLKIYDENVRSIRNHGRKEWKKQSGYHMRSLSETAMFRLKTIFGDGLSARLIETQTTQL